MLLSAVICFWTLEPGVFVLQAAAASQASVSKEKITAVATVLSDNGQRRVTYEIDADRSGVCRISTVDASSGPEPIRYYLFGSKGSLRVLYRPELGQYIEDKYDQRGDFALISSEGKDLDPFLSCLVDADGLSNLFKKFQASGRWKMQTGSGRVRLSRSHGSSATEVVYNTKSRRMTNFAVAQAGSAISWEFSYAPIESPKDPRETDGAFQVKSFDPMLGLAKADSPRTEALLKKAVTFYDKVKNLSYRVDEGGAKYTIHFSKARAFQEAGAVSWSYDGKWLHIINQNQKSRYSGTADIALMVESVGNAGSRVEATLYALMIGRNPLRLMLNNDVSVKSGGNGTVAGERVRWLKANAPMYDMDLAVAERDGFVIQIVTRAKSVDGTAFPPERKTYTRIKPLAPVPEAKAPNGFKSLGLASVR